jgi:hypothetical protein
VNEAPEPMPGYFPPVSAPQPVGYGPPPPGYAPPPAPEPGVSVLAVLAIVAIFFITPGALVLGLVARSQIRSTGQRGMTMAWIGIVIGAIGTLFYLAVAAYVVWLFTGDDWVF